MPISFNDIPDNVRVPFCYVEFDPSKAMTGASEMPYRILVMGQRLATGEVAALTPVRLTNAAQAKKYFGAGSMLAGMLERHFKNNDWTETFAIALDDDAAGQAATGSVIIGGTVTASGTLYFYVAGRRCKISVAAGQAASATATALAAAINAIANCPASAAVDGVNAAKVVVTARHKGEAGNGIDLRVNYYTGETLPEGLNLTFSGSGTSGSPTPPYEVSAISSAVAAYYANTDPARPLQTLPLKGMLPPRDIDDVQGCRLSGGTSNPDIADVWAAVGDVHYHVIAMPYTDSANLANLKEELESRWGPMRMIEGVAFAAAYGTHSALGTLGDAHNSPHLVIMNTGGPWTRAENNLLLYDGIATCYPDADGVMRIQRTVTTYKETALGAEDESYLDVETPLTLGYLRYDFRNLILRKYPRHKLANDGTRYGVGQAMVTPKVIKAECVSWFRQMEERGLVEDFEQFKSDLIVERNADNPCRLDIYLPPNLVNQLRITAVQIGFRL